MPISVKTVEAAIATYAKKVRKPSFNGSVAMSDWYSLFPEEPGCRATAFKWPDNFPNANSPGAYLIFDAKMDLLYVGKTTRTLNSRLGCYFGYVAGRGSGCLIKPNMLPPWKTRPYYVRTIAVTNADEVHALESFLIDRLNPPDNSRR